MMAHLEKQQDEEKDIVSKLTNKPRKKRKKRKNQHYSQTESVAQQLVIFVDQDYKEVDYTEIELN